MLAALPLASLGCLLFLIAVVFTMLGQGGGAIYTPLQVLFGYDFHTAASNSLFLIMVSSLSATIVFRKAHRIDWPLALVLVAAAASGALFGGLFSHFVPAATLAWLFAAVVITGGILMLRQGSFADNAKPRASKSLFAWKRPSGDDSYSVNLVLGLPAIFISGLLSGMVGIGGGVLIIPVLVVLLGVPMTAAIALSAFMRCITAGAGFVGHVVHGHWDMQTAILLAVAVFIGGRIGAVTSMSIDQWKLRRACAMFLIGTAVFMAFEAYVMADVL